MTRIFLFVIIYFSFITFSFSQTDTVGQLNAKGKKQGYWKVYLDSNAVNADSAKAYFIAYEYYHDGKNAFDFYSEKWKTRDSAIFIGIMEVKGKPVLLNGKFTWYDKKQQRITYEESYENGAPMKFKAIRYKKKKGNYTWAFIRTIDFKKRFHAVPGTYFIQEQNNLAIYNMEEWANFWYRKGNRGWKVYRIKKNKPL